MTDDCISRQAVLDGLASIAKVKARSDAQKSLMGRIMFFVEQLPPVTPKEKTGKWIIKDGKEQGYDIAGVKTWYIQRMCDKCGFINTAIEGHTGQYRYCPHCGAKMESEETETWHGIHAQITAQKGTFERIFNDADDDNDI